jgi:hypothetical protein
VRDDACARSRCQCQLANRRAYQSLSLLIRFWQHNVRAVCAVCVCLTLACAVDAVLDTEIIEDAPPPAEDTPFVEGDYNNGEYNNGTDPDAGAGPIAETPVDDYNGNNEQQPAEQEMTVDQGNNGYDNGGGSGGGGGGGGTQRLSRATSGRSGRYQSQSGRWKVRSRRRVEGDDRRDDRRDDRDGRDDRDRRDYDDRRRDDRDGRDRRDYDDRRDDYGPDRWRGQSGRTKRKSSRRRAPGAGGGAYATQQQPSYAPQGYAPPYGGGGYAPQQPQFVAPYVMPMAAPVMQQPAPQAGITCSVCGKLYLTPVDLNTHMALRHAQQQHVQPHPPTQPTAPQGTGQLPYLCKM